MAGTLVLLALFGVACLVAFVLGFASGHGSGKAKALESAFVDDTDD